MVKKLIQLEEGNIAISRPDKLGYEFLPCIPYRKGDVVSQIGVGIMLKVSNLIKGALEEGFYEVQIITGPAQGETVLVPCSLTGGLEKVPSKRQPK